jgi:PAS domain S-box-containing protein
VVSGPRPTGARCGRRHHGLYVVLTDIDDRKRAEEALWASERNLALIINTIPALAWSALPDGSAEFFNRHYLDYLGLSQEAAKGWGWTGAVHPDDLPGLGDTWQLILASGQPGESEARLRRFDGEYRWFLFRTNPLRDDSGNIVKWYGTNTDIDDRPCPMTVRERRFHSPSPVSITPGPVPRPRTPFRTPPCRTLSTPRGILERRTSDRHGRRR